MKDLRYEQAVNNHKSGQSCSASILGAYYKDAGMEEADAMKQASMYAGGRQGICGAVAAAVVALENKYGEEGKEKAEELKEKFKEKNGSYTCREIRSQKLRSCRGCVEDASEFLSDLM